MSNVTTKLILRNLQNQPQSPSSLAAAISVTPHCIRQNLRALREAGKVFISGWVRYADRGPWVPVFSPGTGKNAQKPRPLTDAERMRRRRKENPSGCLDELIRKRKARALKTRPKKEKPEFWRM